MDQTPDFKPGIRLSGAQGNPFTLLTRATRALSNAGLPGQAAELSKRVRPLKTYEAWLEVVKEYVEVR